MDEFKEYVKRLGPGAYQVHEALCEDAPVPQTWPHSEEEWRELTKTAREHMRLKPWFDFAFSIAALGYTPDELATGQLRPGAEVQLLTGRVARPAPATVGAKLRAQARDVLRDLHDLNVSFDPILMVDLQRAAQGAGGEKRAQEVIQAAEGVVNTRRAELAESSKAEREKRLLRVLRPFRAKGGRRYVPGEYRIDHREAVELNDWADKMEAQARVHGWEAPEGFETWPPFQIE